MISKIFSDLINPKIIVSGYNIIDGRSPIELEDYHSLPMPFLKLDIGSILKVPGNGGVTNYERKRLHYYLKKCISQALENAKNSKEIDLVEDFMHSGGPFISLRRSEVVVNTGDLISRDVLNEGSSENPYLEVGEEEGRAMVTDQSPKLVKWLNGLMNSYVANWVASSVNEDGYRATVINARIKLKLSAKNHSQTRFKVIGSLESKYDWVDSLYRYLNEENLISAELVDFRGIFGLGSSSNYKVNWIGAKNKLYYLIKGLPKSSYDTKTKWQAATDCFLINSKSWVYEDLKGSHDTPSDDSFVTKLDAILAKQTHL